MEPCEVRILDHPADLLIEVRAEDYPKALACLCKEVFNKLGRPRSSSSTKKFTLTKPAADLETTTIEILEELLFLFEVKRLYLEDCEVEYNGREVKVEAFMGGFEEFEPKLEIKAVTWHNLLVGRRDDSFVIRVLFDI